MVPIGPLWTPVLSSFVGSGERAEQYSNLQNYSHAWKRRRGRDGAASPSARSRLQPARDEVRRQRWI